LITMTHGMHVMVVNELLMQVNSDLIVTLVTISHSVKNATAKTRRIFISLTKLKSH